MGQDGSNEQPTATDASPTDNDYATDNGPIGGKADASFAQVFEAFADNLTHDDETGAGVCVYVDGVKVVDLWGGYADLESQRVWERGTIVNAYSIGKGVLAALVATLADQGRLDLDLTVADVWPEFAAGGKEDVTLPVLLSHGCGMPAVRKRLPEGAMFDWDVMCHELAAQQPYWEPGTRHGYHVNTFGFLVGEVIRRVTGLRVEEALRTYVTGPLDADFGWGLGKGDASRVAHIYSPQANFKLDGPEQWRLAFPETGDAAYDHMIWHTYFNPSGLAGGGIMNTQPWRAAVIPSTNGHGTARGVAGIYNALLSHQGRAPALASLEIVNRARTTVTDGDDMVLKRPSRFGLGFQLAQPSRPIGPNATTFGHFGYGGSLGYADPDAGVAFGYVRNRPGDRWQTPRTQALVDAVYACLE